MSIKIISTETLVKVPEKQQAFERKDATGENMGNVLESFMNTKRHVVFDYIARSFNTIQTKILSFQHELSL